MTDPTKPTETKEDDEYVSPTSDETLQERYERILHEESQMTEAEIQEKIARLRAPSDLFDWEGNQ
jgi:hypothetical protein